MHGSWMAWNQLEALDAYIYSYSVFCMLSQANFLAMLEVAGPW